MKKLLCFLVIIVAAFSLWSCMTGTQTPICTVHVDNDGDLECDICEAEVTCLNHVDSDENLRCDICKERLECTNHKDVNTNLICDRCAAKLECTHVDANNDGVCDVSVCKWNYDHEHDYDLDWTYNASEHWYEPTCDHDIPVAEKGSHYDMDNDSECDACGYDYGHTHTYAAEWSRDKDTHWRNVTCGHNIQKGFLSIHDDDNNDGICDGCNWNYDHTHEYDTENWTHDKTNHWHAASCKHDVKKDVAAHADKNNDGICDGCEWNYDHEHPYADSWSKDKDNHWHAPSCDHDIPNLDTEAHADENDDGLCDVCEYVVCENHTFNPELWESDETTHWRPSLCGHANAYMEAAGHFFDEDMICVYCGYYTGHEHIYEEEWSHDADNHWHASACDHPSRIKGLAPHTDENNDRICDGCEWNYDHEHTYDTEWSHDEDNHWRNVTCGHSVPNGFLAPHTDSDNDGICDGCAWDYDHEHTYATEWSHDKDNHWFNVTCTHDIPTKDLDAHVDENNDGICDGCAWDYDHTHEYDTEKWTHDKTNHWHAASCGHDVNGIDITPHTDADNDGICDGCAWDYDHKHTYDTTKWAFDENNHFHAADCGHKVPGIDITAHVDEDEDGKCELCFNQFCEHPFSEKWTFDGKYHWHGVGCSHDIDKIDGKAEHFDSDEDDYCDGCGRSMICEHTYDESEWHSDGTHHWYVPTCGHNEDDTKGSYDNHTDVDGNFKCDVCEVFYEDTDLSSPDFSDDDIIQLPSHIITPKNKEENP